MRILVIEDNSDIAANLGDYLEDRGHTVDFAADGVTGLHLAVVHDFDAIVLDLNLPGMDGLELVETLRRRRVSLPALLITTQPTRQVRMRAQKAGVGIVEKPLLAETLGDAINRALTAPPPG